MALDQVGPPRRCEIASWAAPWADFQARVPAKITLVNDDGVLADT